MRSPNKIYISVVIPTCNRAGLLAQMLESLTRQTIPAHCFEVLVVDNRSTDNTAATVQQFASRLPGLRYLYEPRPGLHEGRHCGLKESRGEVIVFADDDIEAMPSWLSAVQEAFADPEVVLVGGNNLPLFAEIPPAWLVRLWNRPGPISGRILPAFSLIELAGPARSISPYYVWGCNFSIRRSTLVSAGGFHPDAMPDELIRFRGDGETHVSRYVAATGGRCLFHPGASVYHKVTAGRMTFSYLRRRGFNQGISDSYTRLRRKYLPDCTPKATIRDGLLQRLIQFGYRKVWDVLEGTKEMRLALREFASGYQEGYAFHQHAFASDPEVRAWVLKPTYLEEPVHDRAH